MNKQDRKRAIQAEMERRATDSGVPPELYVYEIKAHYTDEGGPRPFVPVKVSRNLRSGDHDSSLWPSLMQLATQNGVPIELEPDDTRIFRDGRTPFADCCEWGHGTNHLLILSERANAALEPFLRQTCRPVPVTCASAPLFGYSLKAVEDVLNVDKCKADWHTYAGKKTCTHLTEYSIYTDRLGRSPVFRIPEDDRVLVLQPVVDAAQQHGLTGFRYRRVWPHTSICHVITVDVKKLPQAAKDKRREPKLSTAATEVATGFLEELLGTLTTDDATPAKLVAYRLADLSLPSGSIIAADLLFSEGKPFARQVTPGDYRLTLVAAQVSSDHDERIAFAVIQFLDSPVAVWEVATIGKVAGKRSREGEGDGYGVDSGSGGFCDAGAQEVLLDLADAEGTQTKRIEKEMKKTYRHTRSWVHVQTDAGSAAIFSSGEGDGQYLSYFGLDQAGEPVVLVTDFGILDWPRRPELP